MANKTLLTIIGVLIASGTVQAQSLNSQATAESQEAAQVIKNLVDAGYIQIDVNSGTMVLRKPVLEILKGAGFAMSSSHGEFVSGSCSDTTGHDCSSPTM